MEVDTPEPGSLIEKLVPVAGKGLHDRAGVLILPGKIEASDDTGVLVQAGALRESAQGGLYTPDPNVQIFVGAALWVDAVQREQASASATLKGKNARPDEVRERHDTAGSTSLSKPGSIICVGHSSSSASGSETTVETSLGACGRPAMRPATARGS